MEKKQQKKGVQNINTVPFDLLWPLSNATLGFEGVEVASTFVHSPLPPHTPEKHSPHFLQQSGPTGSPLLGRACTINPERERAHVRLGSWPLFAQDPEGTPIQPSEAQELFFLYL